MIWPHGKRENRGIVNIVPGKPADGENSKGRLLVAAAPSRRHWEKTDPLRGGIFLVLPVVCRMSSKLPDAAPIPDRPPLHLKGGYLCIAAPVSLTEACFSVPAVRALRHFRPQATMAVVCPQSQAPLWQTMEELNEVIAYPDNASSRQIAKLLKGRAAPFESSVSWEAGEAAAAFHRAGVLQRLGYPAKGLEKHLTDPVTVPLQPGPVEHRVRHYLNLVQRLGGNPFVRKTFQTPPLAPAPAKLRIALAPASEYGATHQWPLERFKELVETLGRETGGVDWVILSSGPRTGGNTTAPENAGLAALLEGKAEDFTGEWTMEKTIEGLRHCSALVSCDNELAHLAAHAGLPAVVVFGPNEPAWKRPLGKQCRIVREHVACSPCFLAKCPLDMRCQEAVTVDAVCRELRAALGER